MENGILTPNCPTQSSCVATEASFEERFARRVAEHPERRALTYLPDGSEAQQAWTYAHLDQQARRIGGYLQELGCAGERALVLFPAGPEVVAAMLGAFYAGVVAVPVPPPDLVRLKRTLPRLQAVARDCAPSMILTTSSLAGVMQKELATVQEFRACRWIATDSLDSGYARRWRPRQVRAAETAYLQYTSGSTSTPKGVQISRSGLVGNLEYIREAWDVNEESVYVNWMPYFHDFGLVEGLFQPLYSGATCYLLSPQTFLKRPARWLEAISRHRGTHSSGPNFAFEQALRRTDAGSREGLDLRSWRVACTGAEPVRWQTLKRFEQCFEPWGFSPEAWHPAFGLAEAVLFVSGKKTAPRHRVLSLCASALEKNQIVECSPGETGVHRIVSCGRPVSDMRVVVTDPDMERACAADRIGELWVSGIGTASGYWNRPEESRKTFQARLADSGAGPFLRTGDLGFIRDGEVYITGRLKDLIIVGGANHYPQDIEETVQQSHSQLRYGGTAAFSVDGAASEQLVVLQEIERGSTPADCEAALAAIRQAVAERHELSVWAIRLLERGAVLKTTSGKTQRSACRRAFLDQTLPVVSSWTALAR